MKRRSFLSLLSGAAAALTTGVRGVRGVPAVTEPAFRGILIPYPAAAAPPASTYILNPAWVTAPYEDHYLMGKSMAELLVIRQDRTDPFDVLVVPDGLTVIHDPDPYQVRFERKDDEWIPVYPFISSTKPAFFLP